MSNTTLNQLLDHKHLTDDKLYCLFADIESQQAQIMGHPLTELIVDKRSQRADTQSVDGFHHDYFADLLAPQSSLFIDSLHDVTCAMHSNYGVILTHHQQLIRSCVTRYINHPHYQDDLMQAGQFGLMRAIDMFKLNIKEDFISYAGQQIRSSLQTEFRKLRQLPTNRTAKNRITILSIDQGSTESPEEILKNIISAKPSSAHDDITLFEHENALNALVIETAKCLRPMLYRVLSAVAEHDGRVPKSVKHDMGFSRERFRQLKNEAEQSVRTHFNAMCTTGTFLSQEFVQWVFSKIEKKSNDINNAHMECSALLVYLQDRTSNPKDAFPSKLVSSKEALILLTRAIEKFDITVPNKKNGSPQVSTLKKTSLRELITSGILRLYEEENNLDPQPEFSLEWTDIILN